METLNEGLRLINTVRNDCLVINSPQNGKSLKVFCD